MVRFWDTNKQKTAGWRYMKKMKQDTLDMENKIKARDYCRTRELVKAGGKPPKKRGVRGTSVTGIVNKQVRNAMKGFEQRAIKRARKQTRRAGRADPNELPDPTGYVSALDDAEWIEKYLSATMFQHYPLYEIQREMNLFLDDNPWAKFEVFRGSGKTSLVLAKLIRRVCDNPEERFFLQSENQTKTLMRVRVIRRELQTNAQIIEDYGYLPGDTNTRSRYKAKWSEMQLELKREFTGIEPTIMGISWKDDNALGQHFTGGVLDDPWSTKNQRTTNDYGRFWDWWGEFVGCLEQAKFVWVTCTKKGRHDIYKHWDDDHIFTNLRQPLVVEWPTASEYKYQYNKRGGLMDRALIHASGTHQWVHDECHGKYEMEKVLVIRKRQGNNYFEREYQLNPVPPEGKMFRWADAQWITLQSTDPYARLPLEDLSHLKLAGIYDPAYGVTEKAALNALGCMGWYDHRYYLLKLWIGHWNKQQRIANFREFKKIFPGVPVHVEEDRAQLRLVKDLIEDPSLDGLKIRPFKSKGKGAKYKDMFEGHKKPAKCAKIFDGLEGAWSDRNTYLARGMPGIDELETEIKSFPNCMKFDVVDMLSMGVMVLRKRRGKARAGLTSAKVARGPVPALTRHRKTYALHRRW